MPQDDDRRAMQNAGMGGGPTHLRTLALLVRGKNINEETLLATDYLNHFNEIIMMLDLVPDMPECMEDARAWTPKSYEEHFQDSAFADKDLAIFAYEHAPEQYRVPFDATIQQLDRLVAEGLSEIEAVLETREEGRIRESVSIISRNLQRLIDLASAIIHGDTRTVDQSSIDAIFDS
ncbi:MAG: hypothetical protein V3T80_09480 [Kiloniellales bacterium]